MTPLLIISNLLGWVLAGLFLLLLVNARLANRGWRDLCKAKDGTIRELELQHLSVSMDAERMKWLSDEHTRLSLKCAAICSQIRKMKGRGQSGVHPIHNF